MTQWEFNQHVISILWKLAERVGADRFSEPKHGIIGDEIADMIKELEDEQPAMPALTATERE
jgi:hypothetical protein